MEGQLRTSSSTAGDSKGCSRRRSLNGCIVRGYSSQALSPPRGGHPVHAPLPGAVLSGSGSWPRRPKTMRSATPGNHSRARRREGEGHYSTSGATISARSASPSSARCRTCRRSTATGVRFVWTALFLSLVWISPRWAPWSRWATRAAYEQKGAPGFWAMHEKVFYRPSAPAMSDLDDLARGLNLDMNRWRGEMGKRRSRPRNRSRRGGERSWDHGDAGVPRRREGRFAREPRRAEFRLRLEARQGRGAGARGTT